MQRFFCKKVSLNECVERFEYRATAQSSLQSLDIWNESMTENSDQLIIQSFTARNE